MKRKVISGAAAGAALAVSLAFTGCGSVNPNAVAGTVNGREITAGLANFAAQVMAASYDTYMAGYYGAGMWSQEMTEGSTLADDVRKDIMETLELQYILEEHMGEYNVTLSDSDNESIASAAKEFISENSADALRLMGASEDIVKEYLRLELIENRMEAALRESADQEVSDEEAAQRTISYYQISLPSADSEGEAEEDTDEAALKTYAQEVATAAKADFDAVEEKFEQYLETDSYGGREDEYLPDEVIEAADALKEGGISDLVNTAGGEYYVIRLDSEFDEEATESRKDEIRDERGTEIYDEKTEGWKEAANWVVNDSVVNKISFDNFFNIVDEAEESEAAE